MSISFRGEQETFFSLDKQDESTHERERNPGAITLPAPQGQMAKAGKIRMHHLRKRTALLLDLSLRFHDLLRLHGRKLLGHDL